MKKKNFELRTLLEKSGLTDLIERNCVYPKDGVFSLTAGCRPAPFALTGGSDISRVNSLFREKTEINRFTTVKKYMTWFILRL